MSPTIPKTIYLKDYEAPLFDILTVHLTFLLHETATQVTSRMEIKKRTPRNVPLVLEGEHLILEHVKLDGVLLHETQYEQTNQTLTLHNVPQNFTLEIRNSINPTENKALDGLYLSSDIFCTQNEPEGFRRITYYIDRPDVMSVFTTKIIAPKAPLPVLLSNGNLIEAGLLDDGYHYALWHDPFPKPSYLYALVAGDLGLVQDSFTTRSGRVVDLRIYCDHGNEPQCLHAMHSLKSSMRWDETRFDREYDLDIYMIVAVDAFNMGAMENKGLNIFNAHYVLADSQTATDKDFLGIESVIGHEYFHNWTGNRITCRDWFQLTLKEGLTVFRDQSFSSDLNDAVLQRIDDVSALRSRQFVEDASATAHPIKPESYMQINNFYTATIYEKGAEVIRMIETILGREGFKKGMDLYFATFDGQAITTEDFVWAMGEANGVDLSAFSIWYAQHGTPQLEIQTAYEKASQTFTITFTQHVKEDKVLVIPQKIALFDAHAHALALDIQGAVCLHGDTLLIEHKTQTVTFRNIPSPPVVSINRHFCAPIKLRFDQDDNELAFLMAHDTDAFNRFESSQAYAMKILKNLLAAHQNAQPLAVPQAFTDAFKSVLLDARLGFALKAKMLEIPSIELLMQECSDILIEPLYEVRNFLLSHLAHTLQTQLVTLYESIPDGTTYEITPQAMGVRALKNKLYELLSKHTNPSFHVRFFTRYNEATNMTDRFAMLKILSNLDTPLRLETQEDFYTRYKHNTLVMNKYLSAIASSELEGTLDRVKTLQSDPIYDNIVPNLVRALVGGFAKNPRFFHAKDGSGSRFISEKIISIDLFNPQLASGLAGAFKSYPKMHPTLQARMKTKMEEILAVENLSSNVYEIISKILNNQS